jgi:hypothetical protein
LITDHSRLGLSFFSLHCYKDAVEQYRKAVQLDQSNTAYRESLTKAELKLAQHPEAPTYATRTPGAPAPAPAPAGAHTLHCLDLCCAVLCSSFVPSFLRCSRRNCLLLSFTPFGLFVTD